ncbi:isochorismate synthase [Virgibacillus sp. LDC-1]|uniref:isochorismate synthase n=1 Tax=Virgibacillus sp. LDC-1 TaxID=3039856 RepID=UPI0024DE447F|nr:isochorismate synthase [Virgibacillus sp. LDC-1]
MIEIKANHMEALLQEAIQSLESDEDARLVSITKKIERTNPTQFFEAATLMEKDRAFWASTAEDFYLVGIGNAAEIVAESARFKQTEQMWQQLLNEAIIHNPYMNVPGTGAVALGGMAFDPDKPKTDLWNSFQASQFRIPAILLTKDKQADYLTFNICVHKNDHPVQLAKELERQERKLFTNNEANKEAPLIASKEEIEPEQWKNLVLDATKAIKAGKAKKIVLARELKLTFTADVSIHIILERLLRTQNNSYVFAFEHGEDCFVGATPERLVRLEKEKLLSTCLAGTAPRGSTSTEDEKIAYELLHDSKNREEHDFVVQMIRGAMEAYCTDIDIPTAPVVYPLKNLQHLYTPVTARLKEQFSIFNVLEHLHPTPALGGSPNKESMEFIRENELLDRGWYGAPVGWLDSNQHGEFAVAIRSGLIRRDKASLFAGCGVVKDSDPQAEYEETNVKFLPMLSVLGGQL